MSKAFYKIIDDLPASNMTTRVLKALDWVVPGEYQNVVGFENTIKHVTGETDQKTIQTIGERALALYNDKSQGYQTALWLYETVDTLQGLGGFSAMVNKIGESVSFLKFLNKLTPKADTTQAIDLGIKLVAEIVCFTKLNGIPGDRIGDFIESLADVKNESLMRMAGLVCLDGIVPLGPDFVNKTMSILERTGADGLVSNKRFDQIKQYVPGKNAQEQLSFVEKGLASTKGWIQSFVKSHDVTQNKIVAGLSKYVDGVESKLDYLGAFLDMSCNYFEHTGTQSVARSLISRAAAEI